MNHRSFSLVVLNAAIIQPYYRNGFAAFWRTGEADLLHAKIHRTGSGDSCMNQAIGRVSAKDLAMARTLKFAPWLVLLVTSLPVPVIFLVLFFVATATESAAIFLLLAGLSLGLGLFLGLLAVVLLALYRRRWLAQLRDRLASDGITASEVVWFRSELTSAERASLSEIEQTNPLLADAYLETLASRLTASRIISKSRRELLKVERRLSRARMLNTPESLSLQKDLESDHERLSILKQRATDHLANAKTRLQTIEATASRNLNQAETDVMMQRLGSAQDQLPLVLEMAHMEQQALIEAKTELGEDPVATTHE